MRPVTLIVDQPSDQFLACPTLTSDQDRRWVARYPGRHPEGLLHRRGAGDDLIVATLHPHDLAEPADLLSERLSLDCLPQGQDQLIGAEGLRDIIICPELHRLHGQVDTSICRHYDDERVSTIPPLPLEESVPERTSIPTSPTEISGPGTPPRGSTD